MPVKWLNWCRDFANQVSCKRGLNERKQNTKKFSSVQLVRLSYCIVGVLKIGGSTRDYTLANQTRYCRVLPRKWAPFWNVTRKRWFVPNELIFALTWYIRLFVMTIWVKRSIETCARSVMLYYMQSHLSCWHLHSFNFPKIKKQRSADLSIPSIKGTIFIRDFSYLRKQMC